jgi:DNA-binding HxlR family transcriptional regulator
MGPAGNAVDTRAPGIEHDPAVVCATYHQAIELIGKRWTGAILSILLRGPARFHVVVSAVPGMSERLCADRLRELEAARLVTRRVLPGPPVAVEYALTDAGRDLDEALSALGKWAHRWLEPAPAAGLLSAD